MVGAIKKTDEREIDRWLISLARTEAVDIVRGVALALLPCPQSVKCRLSGQHEAKALLARRFTPRAELPLIQVLEEVRDGRGKRVAVYNVGSKVQLDVMTTVI